MLHRLTAVVIVCLGAITCIVCNSLAMHHPLQDGYPHHVDVRPTDPVFWANWSPRDITLDNPRGYSAHNSDDARDYLGHPAAFIYAEFHRTDANGDLVQRYMARMERPTHNELFGGRMVPFGVWHGMDTDRRTIVIDAVLARQKEDREAERPEMTFGLYVAAWNNGSPYTTNMSTATGVTKFSDVAEKKRWLETIGPWLSTGVVSEVWYDWGSPAQNIGAVATLIANQESAYNLHGAIEALFHLRDNDPNTPWPGDITWHYIVPQMCISRFILDRDPSNTLTWESDQEVHIINSPNKRIDGSSGAFGATLARCFTRRGWLVGSNRRALDQYINLPLVGGPNPEPDPNRSPG